MSNNEETERFKKIEPPPSPVESQSSDVSEVVLWSSSSSSSSDETLELVDSTAKSFLNFSSPTFSPTLALACPSSEIVPIVPGSKKYLNLQQYSKAIQSPSKSPRKDVSSLKQKTVKELEAEAIAKSKSIKELSTSSSKDTSTLQFPIPGRRFLPHQLPVYRPRKEHPNTLTLMETVEGPLSVLRRVMTENLRVKLWTRNEKGFRGFLTGFVDAFDKHWNLVLRDVDEQFVRKKVIKFPPFIENPEVNCDHGKEAEVSLAFNRLQNYLRQNNETTHNYSSSCSSILPKKRKNTNNPINYLQPEGVVVKSKTVFVGEINPISICRTGLSKLSLLDGDDRKSGQNSCLNESVPKIPKNISKTMLKNKSLTIFKTPFEDHLGFYVVAQSKKFELVQRHIGQVLLMGNDIVFIETKGC